MQTHIMLNQVNSCQFLAVGSMEGGLTFEGWMNMNEGITTITQFVNEERHKSDKACQSRVQKTCTYEGGKEAMKRELLVKDIFPWVDNYSTHEVKSRGKQILDGTQTHNRHTHARYHFY
jgi:hypothetical protein